MKIELYQSDDIRQVILTAEDNFERSMLKELANKQLNTEIFYGNFGTCVGGYVRDFGATGNSYLNNKDGVSSLMLTQTKENEQK